MHRLYEVQGGKGKNSGQEGQARNRPIIDWTHGAGLVSFSFFLLYDLQQCTFLNFCNLPSHAQYFFNGIRVFDTEISKPVPSFLCLGRYLVRLNTKIRLASVVNAADLVIKLGLALIYFVLIVKSLGMVVTRRDTPKYDETPIFMYIK